MTAADLEFYQAFLFAFGLAALSATVAWWRARKRALRAEAEVAELRGELRAELRAESRAVWVAAPEHAGLQNAVDAIAIEVERIGEGQRFLTRTMREPAPGADPPLP